ncbi:MAG TPA: zinc-ribbon domain-containing protein [Polyangiaceae bacterium]|nr:zinc-ribbon domain-containing protein [Polyangiaceae bacterium]
MDVRCNRCSTDYEFDDALISDRGTTVQCTNCGYQFKIYPERKQVTSPERWVVHTMSGKELVYTSLRDLQRAIGAHQVGPKDLLSRGNQPSRPLGSIPELEPFFMSGVGQARGMQSVPQTLHGVAPPPTGAPRPVDARVKATQRGFGLPSERPRGTMSSSVPPAGDFEQRAAPSRVLGVEPGAATERQPPLEATPTPARGASMSSTQRSGTPAAASAGTSSRQPAPRTNTPTGVKAATPPVAQVKSSATVRLDAPNLDATLPAAAPPVTHAAGRAVPEVEVRSVPAVQPRAPDPVARPRPHVDTNPGPIANFDATLPAPPPPGADLLPSIDDDEWPGTPGGSSPLGSPLSSPRAAPMPGPAPVSTREHLSSYDELPLEEQIDPARRARSRWIAGVVFVGVVVLLGATLGRQYLVRLSTGGKAEPAKHDDRVTTLLQEGMRLIDQADYDGAQSELAKAQAFAERDPGVLAGFARLETARADLAWLKLRLLDPTSQELVQETTRDLGDRAAKARQASDAAFAVAADDPTVIRARVDAMRIAGEEAKAREWIAPIAANASDPQNAYVLAALDLSEAAPAFGTVIDRLRAAAVSEHEAVRARGALIYALVRAGRVVEAETELAKVTAAERPHPLADALKAFVARFSAPLDAGADAAVVVTSPAASVANHAPAANGAEKAPSGEAAPAGDFRSRLTHAAQALQSGNLETAYTLYQSVVGEQPNNTEAISGLADVARRRGDNGTAMRLYGRVLDVNPSYLPALMAYADAKWAAGDHQGALLYYKRVLEQSGPSTDYGQRAQARINQAEGGGSSAPSGGTTTPAATTTTTPTSTAAPTATSETPAPPPSHPEIDTSDLPGVKLP